MVRVSFLKHARKYIPVGLGRAIPGAPRFVKGDPHHRPNICDYVSICCWRIARRLRVPLEGALPDCLRPWMAEDKRTGTCL